MIQQLKYTKHLGFKSVSDDHCLIFIITQGDFKQNIFRHFFIVEYKI
jgi:hypothetical protein